MAAYYYELVAIKYNYNDGSYEIESKSEIETLKIDRKQLNNVSADTNFVDEATVIAKKDLPKYLLSYDSKTKNWYEQLPESVALILIVSREWETGLS